MKKKTKNREILEELAEEEFGTTNVSAELRGEARRLAKESGCTPYEALPLAQENLKKYEQAMAILKNLVRAHKKSKKSTKTSKTAKKYAELGRPKFSRTVQGGAPGLKSQK